MHSYNHIHFIGIGGMGVSAAAQIAFERGFSISGSDLQESKITKNLSQKGIDVSITDEISWPNCTDLIVHTNALDPKNPAIAHAQENGISVVTYPEFAKMLIKDKKVIAVSGTHGKTTTTAIIAQLLINAKLDPTVIIGSSLQMLGGNARSGEGGWVVIEADEYKNAFHNYQADIAIITSLEYDHPDVFDSFEAIKRSFSYFVQNSKQQATLIGWAGSDDIIDIIDQAQRPHYFFGINHNAHGDIHATNVVFTTKKTSITIRHKNKEFECTTNLAGIHNVQNILAAYAVAVELKISQEVFCKTIKNIELPWRRFEIKAEKNNHVVIDDYAHHPTEIKATIQAARERYADKKIIAIFEPHHEGRTEELFDDFAKSFNGADSVILTDIYQVPGRRVNTSVDIKKMADMAHEYTKKSVKFVKNKHDIAKQIKSYLDTPSVILVMGAGSINSITEDVIKAL